MDDLMKTILKDPYAKPLYDKYLKDPRYIEYQKLVKKTGTK